MSYNPAFSGITSTPASQSVQAPEANATGSTLTKLSPVRVNSSGNLALIDVSVESEALSIAGIVNDNITTGNSGNIVNSGRILDITTSAVFGEVLFVSKTGGVTATKPSIGVDGFAANDFVIKLGLVVKNADNPLNKDLLVSISIVGQL